jgi:hypothetical protein
MPAYLSFSADLLMVAASLGAAVYCLILSRRLSRLTSFDKGIGGAIAVMSQQVDEMKSALSEARSGTDGAGHHLQSLVGQAREISGELEMMIAACHDFAEEAMVVQGAASAGSESKPQGTQVARTPAPLAEVESTSEPEVTATPVFGSRRAPVVAEKAAAVFRRHVEA